MFEVKDRFFGSSLDQLRADDVDTFFARFGSLALVFPFPELGRDRRVVRVLLEQLEQRRIREIRDSDVQVKRAESVNLMCKVSAYILCITDK